MSGGARVSLVFCRGAGLADALIRAYDHGYWNHVECLTADGRRLGAQNVVYAGVAAGVQIRPAGYAAFTAERQVDLPATDEQCAAFWAFLERQLGKPYDMPGLVGNFVRSTIDGAPLPLARDWREPTSWWCSELAGAALEAAGVFRWPLATPLNLLTPDGLFLACSAIANVYGNAG